MIVDKFFPDGTNVYRVGKDGWGLVVSKGSTRNTELTKPQGGKPNEKIDL